MAEPSPASRFKSCFVSAPSGPALAAISEMLRARGVATQGIDVLPPGAPLNDELIRAIAGADFVIVVLRERGSEHTIFELGVARGMGKPALVFSVGRPVASDLHGIIYRTISGLDQIGEVAPDLDRFLRNAKPPPPPTQDTPTSPATDLRWARRELEFQRQPDYPGRYEHFEGLVGRVLEAAGAEIRRAGHATEGRGVDFVVWLNDVAFALGGPILVECKVLKGGSGSVIKNAEAAVNLIARALARSGASLGLLIFDHDRPQTPPTLFGTPNVIAFSIEDLIDGLEGGTFEQEVMRRKRRAAVVGGAGA